jgi:glycogen debranching enzyme
MLDPEAAPPEQPSEQAVEGLAQLLSLKSGQAFLVCNSRGDITGGADGLFVDDTRLLSRFVLCTAGVLPSRLQSGVSGDNVFFVCHATNRPLPPMGGKAAPAGTLHIERRRLMCDGRVYERIRLSNFGSETVLLPLTFDFGADFRDIFEVRGAHRPARGELHPPVVEGRWVRFGYHGLDGVERTSVIHFSTPPGRLGPDHARFLWSLDHGESEELYVEIGVALEDTPSKERFRQAAARARLERRTRRRAGASVTADPGSPFHAWIDQARSDVALLSETMPTGPYPLAGIPWYCTPFGRDGIITAWQLLWLEPGLAAGVLRYLAGRQATRIDAFADSQPGKIMHETRGGEMCALGEMPFGLYYGGVDTTCLFIGLAGAYWRRTGDLDLIRGIWPNLIAAAGWMAGPGDSNGDGLIDYARASETGLANQGWKDSGDSIFHADGRFPVGPVALVEVQGYAFAAWSALADMADALGEGGGVDWRARAERVRELVEERFWIPDEKFYAVALDGDGRQCRAITSNPGHLLFSGLPEPSRASAVAERLLSAEFRTGWGVRTLARGQARYNPMAYHNGSVWPHDTAIAAAGMARYGERDAARMLLSELFDAATNFEMRLPELFCGFDRRPGEPPVAYPVACMPQAWAAGSVFMLLQATLGVEIDAPGGRLSAVAPRMPRGIGCIQIEHLRLPGGSVDIRFREQDEEVAATVSNLPEGFALQGALRAAASPVGLRSRRLA